MLKNKVLIPFYLFFVIGMAACGTPKKVVTSEAKTASKETSTNTNSEYNAFFEAEKARIKGDKAKARTLYRNFVKVYKNNDAALYNLAQLEFNSFQFKDAEEYVAKAVEIQPKNKYYLELYADVLSVNKKQKKAVDIYENLSKLYIASADEYNYKKYKIYSELGDFDNAFTTLNKLEDSWGVSPEISLQKVELLLQQKKEDAAINEIKKLIINEPQEPSYKERLARLYDDLGRKEEAKKVYNDLVNDAPNDAKILMRTSSYYLRNKDTVGFKRVVKNIVTNQSIDRSIRMNMLLPLIEMNSDSANLNNEILPLMQSLREGDDSDAQTDLLYADVLYNARQYGPAAKAYKEYLAKDKSKFAAWFNLMLSYSSLDQLDNLIATAEESFDYFPNNAFTHYFKGTAHYQKKEYEKSITSLQSAIDLEPEKELKAQIFSMLGDAYNSLKNYTKADENFDKSLAIKEDATTLNNYAYYLSLRNDRLADALKMSERSLELNPGSKTFLDTYGWILYKQGKFEKAKGYIEKALEGEGDADVLEHLGDIYFKLNDSVKAIEYWQRAKKVGGGGSPMLDKKIQEGKLYE